MSKVFQDVGEVVSLPFKNAYNVVTGNPKGNSIGDIWNNTIGPGNPLEQLAYDMPGQSLARKATGNDASKMFTAPNWDTMGRPGEAFAERVDNMNKIFPSVLQPYAQPLEAFALNFVPGAGPLLSAGYNTAYQAGKQQQQNKGVDWGEIGKNAAINFGTAGLTMGANKLISMAKTSSEATAAARAAAGPSNFSPTASLKGGADAVGSAALDPFSQLARTAPTDAFSQFGTSAATPGFAGNTASNLYSNSVNAFNSYPKYSMSTGFEANMADQVGSGKGVFNEFSPMGDSNSYIGSEVYGKGLSDVKNAVSSEEALNAIGMHASPLDARQGPQTVGNSLRSVGAPDQTPRLGSSMSNLPAASAVQSSGIGNAAYNTTANTGNTLLNATIRTGESLGKNALASTLAPNTQPIAGALDNFGNPIDGQYSTQWGDVLNAFGGSEINTPNPEGYRINNDAMNKMIDRLGANTYLQQSQARDQAIPAGQFQSEQNTPYANRLSSINKGADQSYKDLAEQVNNANRYYSVIDSNPGLNPEDLDKFLADPSTGVLGQFRVPTDQLDYFKGIRTLGPQNMSLL